MPVAQHATQHPGEFADMKIIVGLISLVLLSAMTGTGLAFEYGVAPHSQAKIHTNLFLAAEDPPSGGRSQEGINARMDERVNDLAAQEQSAREDRRLIHDEIYQLTMLEKTHYDTLHEQISVDESWLHVSTALFGGGLGLLNALALYVQLTERKRRKALQVEAAA